MFAGTAVQETVKRDNFG